MVSLGYFFQKKKLSLELQESEAHGAFLRVIELMRSPKAIDHVEGVQLCGQIVSRYASPTIVNSAFMRMAETFRAGSSVLQVEVLRIIQRNTEHLKKIQNHTEFIRPIFSVMYSNDPVGRAITLRLLAAIAVNVPDQFETHHAVRMALQSSNRNELEAALVACRSLARVTPKFAEAIAEDIISLMEKPHLSDDEKITILEIVPSIASSNLESETLIFVVSKLLSSDMTNQSSRLVETIFSTLSGLHKRNTALPLIESHLALLGRCIGDSRWEIARPASTELMRFFEFCASRLPTDSALNFIKTFLLSNTPFVVSQGLKCLFLYLRNTLTDHRACVADVQLMDLLPEKTSQLKGVVRAFAFALYCRMFAVSCYNQTPRPATAASKSDNMLLKRSETLKKWMSDLAQNATETQNSGILHYVLFGLSPRNYKHFLSQITHGCLEILPRFAIPSENFERKIVIFIRNISEEDPVRAHALLDKCYPLKSILAGNKMYAIVAAAVGISLRIPDFSEESQQHLAKQIIESCEISLWDLYKLARTASVDGRHYFASEIYNYLAADEQVHGCPYSHGWIEVLRQMTDYEINKKKLLAPGSELDDIADNIGDCLMEFMETSVKLTEYRTPDRYGYFKKNFLDVKVGFQRAWELMLETLEQIRGRGMDMGDPEEDLEQVASHLLLMRATLLDPMNEFRTVAERCDKLYKMSFDADGPSLGVVRLYHQICCRFAVCLASLGGRGFSADTAIPSTPLAPQLGVAAALERLDSLSKTTLSSISPTDFYEVVKELFRLSGFFLSLQVPIPRYFFQQYQSTSLAVVITPSSNAETEFAQTINMDTRFTLKVDCALTVEREKGCQPIRTVKDVRVTVRMRLMKSLPFSSKVIHSLETPPEVLVHTVPMEEINFFSHSFVIFLGYPGIYRISVDLELIDCKLSSWDAMQNAELYVKVTEGLGGPHKRKAQDNPPQDKME